MKDGHTETSLIYWTLGQKSGHFTLSIKEEVSNNTNINLPYYNHVGDHVTDSVTHESSNIGND